MKIVWLLSAPLVLLYFFGGKYLLRLFLDEPAGLAMTTGIQFLRILAPFYFVVSMKLVADGILRGAECMKQFMIATFTDLVLRVVLAKVLSVSLGTVGIWLAWPIGWVAAMLISVVFYKSGCWKTGLIDAANE